MGIEKTTGSISPGYRADAVLWQSKNYKQLPYFYGSNQVYQIMVGGKPVL
jgi:imidazolonepropionase-like amidohydrolase